MYFLSKKFDLKASMHRRHQYRELLASRHIVVSSVSLSDRPTF